MIELDIIGPLFDPPLVDGGEPVSLAGWHINTTLAGLTAKPDLAAYVVTPNLLRRVWAGDDAANPTTTVALRFADEAEAQAVLGLGDA